MKTRGKTLTRFPEESMAGRLEGPTSFIVGDARKCTSSALLRGRGFRPGRHRDRSAGGMVVDAEAVHEHTHPDRLATVATLRGSAPTCS